MEDKLHPFFSENNFDFQEPHTGHLERFERKPKNAGSNHKTSWKWLSVAASVVLVLGFWLGSNHQKQQIDLAAISPEMEEVQTYFVSTINQELKTLEENRNLETETIIENALEELEELEDYYKVFVQELTENGQQRKIISAMIKNYQAKVDILNRVLEKVEAVNAPQKTIEDEISI